MSSPTKDIQLSAQELAPYLPHQLLCEWNDRRNLDQPSSKGILTRIDMNSGVPYVILQFLELADKFDSECMLYETKPYLRPLSQLIEEIQHNSKTFVPIVELAKVAFEKITDVSMRPKTLSKDDTSYGVYIDSNQCSDTLKNLYFGFIYYNGSCSFQAVTGNDPFAVGFHARPQLKLFQMLHEWHFDLYQLIERGSAHAIVNTIKG